MTTTITLTEALAEHQIRLKDQSIGQHRTLCPRCSHTRKKKNDPCLSVKVDEDGATWTCFNCAWADGVVLEKMQRRAPRKEYRRPPKPPAVGGDDGRKRMLAWFAKRGIGEETVDAFQITRTQHWFPQVERELDCIAFPYRHAGELVNVKYRAQVASEAGGFTKMFAQEKGAERTLFNADAIEPDELIVVEGEMDVMACWEAGYRSVVSLPDGAGKDVQQNQDKRLAALGAHTSKLAAVKRVVIATDGDGPGDALAQALALRFGLDRCSRVRWPAGTKDANEVLMQSGAAALTECIARAKPFPIEGVHDIEQFESVVDDLYHNRVARPLSTGIKSLDQHLRIVPGAFYVVSGIPNHGKSSFVDQLVVNMGDAHGWRTAYFSPEHSPPRHIARLAEKVERAPFYAGPTPRMSHDQLQHALRWLDDRVMFVVTNDESPTVDWLIERFRWCAIQRGINAVVIDPWNEVESSRPPSMTETEFIGLSIQKLKRFAAAHEVAVFVVVHPTKMQKQDGNRTEPAPGLYDLAGSAHWRNKADIGFVVHREDMEDSNTLVIVRKVREQPVHGEIGAVTVRFNPRTRCYENLDPDLNGERYDEAV